MALFELCQTIPTISIVGTAKNVGKTTCLNHLIARYEAKGMRLGLTSFGRDGEDFDQLTDRPKPRIMPPPGTLVATSRLSAKRSTAKLREISTTPFRTAIGPVGLYEVLTRGFVEIAGPVTVEDTVELKRLLREAGAEITLVDGAIDRRASASSAVADGVILATGMSLELTEQEIAEHALLQTRWLNLPASLHLASCERTGVLLGSGAFLQWPGATVLEHGDALLKWLPADADTLILAGALTERLALRLLTGRRHDLSIIVPDGTHLLLEPETFGKLEHLGVRFHAVRPIRLIAVTVNPTRPDGQKVDAKQFQTLVQERLAPIPVFDVLLDAKRSIG